MVIICWNDRNYILDCIRSVYSQTSAIQFEVIVADNGSDDGSIAEIAREFPQVRIIENGRNLGFGPGNNSGFKAALGEYVLILNPDTIIRDRALETLSGYADAHPEAAAFACRVLRPDGSLEHTVQPRPTVRRYLVAALCLRWLGRLSNFFLSDVYPGWTGTTEKQIGFQAACCLLVRHSLLSRLGGFDERFSHQFEDADLCHRIWQSGSKILFCPDAEITHIGGHNRGGYPTRVLLETERSKYRYFHKHYGMKAALRIRWVTLIGLALRYGGYRLKSLWRGGNEIEARLEQYRVLLRWTVQLNPAGFITNGEEPDLGYKPFSFGPDVSAPGTPRPIKHSTCD